MRNLILAVLLLAPSLAAHGATDLRERARTLTDAFYAGEMDRVWQHLDSRMRGALGSRAELTAFRGEIRDRLGTEEAVLSEELTEKAGYSLYLRTADFDAGADPVWVQWTFDSNGRVAGFFIMPAPRQSP